MISDKKKQSLSGGNVLSWHIMTTGQIKLVSVIKVDTKNFNTKKEEKR